MTAMVNGIKIRVALKMSAVYVFNRDVCFCIVKKNVLCFLFFLGGGAGGVEICAPILSNSFHILITLSKVLTVCI